MPLNPPSYKGQDVWYSPNVYINKVPAALWQPPKIGDSLIFNFTLPPDPTQPSYAPSVLQYYSNLAATDQQSTDNGVVEGYNAGTTYNQINDGNPPVAATPNNLVGTSENADQVSASPLVIPPGNTPYQTLSANLQQTLAEAKTGAKWKGGNSAEVTACFAEMGQAPQPRFWCAAYAGTILKRSGISYVKNNIAANGFRRAHWGQPRSLNDYQSWRLYDLIAWEHHVAFLVAVDPAKGKLWVHGGNQGSNDTAGSSITISHRSDLSAVNFISRNWEIPAEFDKPVIKSL